MCNIIQLFPIALFFFASVSLAQKPWEPVPRNEKWWHDYHQQFLNTTATRGKDINVLFIGSSLIEYWLVEGKRVWMENYDFLGAAAYGIHDDETGHLLWRIQDGELDGLNPKLVVLYIGSNNVPRFPDNDEIVHGVNTVVSKIHEKLPHSNILLVGTFPRGDQKNTRFTLRRIRDINNKVRELVDGDKERKSHFLDLFWFLARPSMNGIKEELYIPDKLHLNQRGYRMWAREMNSIFQSLMQ